jgi:hypothetical protein
VELGDGHRVWRQTLDSAVTEIQRLVARPKKTAEHSAPRGR